MYSGARRKYDNVRRGRPMSAPTVGRRGRRPLQTKSEYATVGASSARPQKYSDVRRGRPMSTPTMGFGVSLAHPKVISVGRTECAPTEQAGRCNRRGGHRPPTLEIAAAMGGRGRRPLQTKPEYATVEEALAVARKNQSRRYKWLKRKKDS